jgi:hypothetical protein
MKRSGIPLRVHGSVGLIPLRVHGSVGLMLPFPKSFQSFAKSLNVRLEEDAVILLPRLLKAELAVQTKGRFLPQTQTEPSMSLPAVCKGYLCLINKIQHGRLNRKGTDTVGVVARFSCHIFDEIDERFGCCRIDIQG